jgi:hypothetical protein
LNQNSEAVALSLQRGSASQDLYLRQPGPNDLELKNRVEPDEPTNRKRKDERSHWSGMERQNAQKESTPPYSENKVDTGYLLILNEYRECTRTCSNVLAPTEVMRA